jgi:hypothetical protein
VNLVQDEAIGAEGHGRRAEAVGLESEPERPWRADWRMMEST